FSPGYGDFDLKNQRIFYSLLHLEQFGIHLTESYMLVPEKSVIAMTGVR
ncbi:MAG: methionine synthase, partial [Spirochaetia bacterium]|nr:methionine synthase [Spirochaetia bacterium]